MGSSDVASRSGAEEAPPEGPSAKLEPRRAVRYCDFCGKGDPDVSTMIAGNTACICDECVQLCVEILSDRARQAAATPSQEPKT